MADKLYAPDPPRRFCKRCGAEVVWQEPEGWVYDELSGKPLSVRILGTCPNLKINTIVAEAGGCNHFSLYLFWTTQKQENNGRLIMDTEHWYTRPYDSVQLKSYCDISKIEALVKSKKNNVDVSETVKIDDEIDPF